MKPIIILIAITLCACHANVRPIVGVYRPNN